jgi:hypothetical protein
MPLGQQIVINGAVFPSLSAEPLPLKTVTSSSSQLFDQADLKDVSFVVSDDIKTSSPKVCVKLYFA